MAIPTTSAYADGTITSEGPLTSIAISPDLNCAVHHTGDQQSEFFGENACGTFAAVGGNLFGPAAVPAGDSAAPRIAWTPVSQSAVTGAGTAADPFTVVTVVDGVPDQSPAVIRVTETDSYVVGEESYRTDVQTQNLTDGAQAVVLYRAGDCYLQDSDSGFGRTYPGGGVACVAEQLSIDPYTQVPTVLGPGSRVEQWFPLTAGSHYMEGGFDDVWTAIGTQQPFDDTCRCSITQTTDPYEQTSYFADDVDNGAGLSWSSTVPAGGSVTQSHLTSFSPTGVVPLTTSKTADTSTAVAGGSDGYTITLTNDGAADVPITTITDTLPAGFSYVRGSSTGATTSDPALNGQTLTWTLSDVTAAARSTVTEHFAVTVPCTAGGPFTNSAGATATGAAVVGVSDTAPVTVTGACGGPSQPDATSVTAASVDAQYSDAATLSATLTDDTTEQPLGNATVTFTFHGNTYPAVTNGNGVAEATVPHVLLAPDTYGYTADYAGDQTHAGSTDTNGVDVTQEDCTLTYTGATSASEGSVVLSAALGEPDTSLGDRSGKTITFSYSPDGGEPQTTTAVTDANGVAATSVLLTQGSWTVAASFTGDDFYTSCGDERASLTVGPPAPPQQLQATSLKLDGQQGIGYTAQYSDPLDVTATLTSGAGLAGQVVTFTLGSATVSGVTNSLGVATASIPVTVPSGSATLHAAFTAAGGYLASTDSTPVDVAPESCALSYTGAVAGREGSASTLAASMTEPDATLGDRSDKSITFLLTHGSTQESVTAVTNAAGAVTATKKLAPGTWQVRPTFAGDTFYAACDSRPSSLVVKPLLLPTDTEIVSVPDSVQYSDHVSVSLSLTKVGGTAAAPGVRSHRLAPAVHRAAGPSADGIGGAPVNVSLGSAHATVITDGSGHAEASLKVQDPAGTKTLHVDYGGDSNYAASHTSSQVHLKLEDTSLSYTGDTSADSATGATVAAVLSEEDPSVGDLAGHTISFLLQKGGSSRNVSAATNGSGRASASVTLPAGTWSVTPTFAGDEWYRPSTGGSASIVVTDAPADTTPASEPSTGPSGPSGPTTGPDGNGGGTHVLGEKVTRPPLGESPEAPAAGEPGGGEHGAAGAEGEHGSGAEHPLNTKQPTFVLSIPDVHEVSLGSSTVLINGLLALLMILMIAFPAELFNGTLKENYDEVRGWFGPITRFLHRIEASAIHGHPAVRTFGSMVFVGLTGVIYAFVEPGFGFDRKSLQLILALTFGLVVITVLANESALLFGRLRYHEKGRLRARPGALLVALACVLLSRAANFEPGYVYGLVAGFTFSRELPRRQDGKVVLAWAGWLLALAAGGWLLLSPVKGWALHHETSFWAPVVEELTAAVVVESLTILILALVPLSFLEGERIWKWRRSVWVVVYGMALFAFLHVVVHPEFSGRRTELPLFTWLGFFAGFGLFSVSFWAYFRFRHHEHAEA